MSINKICLLTGEYFRLKNIDTNTVKTLKRLPGYDTLRLVLAQKIILVEGPSDELLIKKVHLEKKICLPEEKGVDIIVVRGIGFKNYLNIAKHLKHPVRVVKDNDRDYKRNILDRSDVYKNYPFITFYSPEDEEQYSLEPALVEANADTQKNLDHFAKIILSKKTYNKYMQRNNITDKKQYLIEWFNGESGGKKVDSAMRIFESKEKIKFPSYLIEVVEFNA